MKTEEDVHAIRKQKNQKSTIQVKRQGKSFAKRYDKQHENTFKCKYCVANLTQQSNVQHLGEMF